MPLGLARSRGRVEGDLLHTEGGATVDLIWGDPYRAIAQCDLALSLPGTNTAELAIAGKPAVIPITDRVPVGGGGLLGLLDRLPGFGKLKVYLKHRKYRRLKFLALPNQLAGRMVMPELFIRDDLSDLFDFLAQLLENAAELSRIGNEAREVMGPPGAAERFVHTVESILEKP
jgi:lipid-A-disaccharide synthase